MPLPALPVLAALWAAKTAGGYYGYKKLKEKKPELVAEWERKAKDFKQEVKGLILGDDADHAKDDDDTPSPDL